MAASAKRSMAPVASDKLTVLIRFDESDINEMIACRFDAVVCISFLQRHKPHQTGWSIEGTGRHLNSEPNKKPIRQGSTPDFLLKDLPYDSLKQGAGYCTRPVASKQHGGWRYL